MLIYEIKRSLTEVFHRDRLQCH